MKPVNAAVARLHPSGTMLRRTRTAIQPLTSSVSPRMCTCLACSVTGNAKDIATTAIGWLVFTGFKATVKSVGGILISFMGAFLYSYVGLRKTWAAAGAAAAAGASSSSGGSSGAVGSGVASSSGGVVGGKAVTPAAVAAALPADAGRGDVEAGDADIAEAGSAGVKKGSGPGEAHTRHRGGEVGQRSPRENSIGADVEAAHLLAGVAGGALAAPGSAGSTGSGVHAPISYAEWQATGGYREGGSLSGRT